jgi:hypothetical protein
VAKMSQIPLARVKHIMKLDSDVHMASQVRTIRVAMKETIVKLLSINIWTRVPYCQISKVLCLFPLVVEVK